MFFTNHALKCKYWSPNKG